MTFGTPSYTTTYPTWSSGQITPIPGSTIGAIYNAVAAGRISKPEAAVFLPAIREWAKSTNQHAAAYAINCLQDWHSSVSAADVSHEVSSAGK
jgi:hypothetical protein